MAAGAEHFAVISSIGADASSRFLYLKTKGQMEAGLRQLGLKGLFIFRPAMLLGRRRNLRAGEWMGKAADLLLTPLLLLVPPLRRYKAIEAKTVAAAMLRAVAAGPAGVQVYESEQMQGFA